MEYYPGSFHQIRAPTLKVEKWRRAPRQQHSHDCSTKTDAAATTRGAHKTGERHTKNSQSRKCQSPLY